MAPPRRGRFAAASAAMTRSSSNNNNINNNCNDNSDENRQKQVLYQSNVSLAAAAACATAAVATSSTTRDSSKRAAATSNTGTTTIISATITDFPDTIDPTILSTNNRSSKNKKKNDVAASCFRNLFQQDEHDNCIAVATSLTRHQATLWMSALGAHAAARHCLPELRLLGVVKRKLVLGDPAPRAAAASSINNNNTSTMRSSGHATRGASNNKNNNKSNNNKNNDPICLVQLFQQEQQQQQQHSAAAAAGANKKEKTTKDNNTPTLKISKTSTPMPKAKCDQLALESYLRHGETVPSSSALLEQKSRQLLMELNSWHGGAMIKGPGFASKRAWFDRHGQLPRLGHNYQISLSSSSNNSSNKKKKTSKKNNAARKDHHDDNDNDTTTIAITTTVTQLLDFFQRGILQEQHELDDETNKVVRVLQREIPIDTLTVLHSLQELATPHGGGLYNVPLVVSIPILKQQQQSSSSNSTSNNVVELEISIYCHRLLFECDYANDLLIVMSALDPDSYRILEPLLPPPAKPIQPVFESDKSHTVVESKKSKRQQSKKNDNTDDEKDDMDENDADDDDNLSCCTRDENELSPFSKQGLLKLMESKGNDISVWPVIQEKLAPYFQIQLMLHQVHGICWMMQMEQDVRTKSPKHGLNALLWEVRQFSDGHGIYYYSPVLGQIRLHLEKCPFHEPRPVSGGLLCDMVGLGKTVQVLALVCATARDDDDQDDDDDVDASGACGGNKDCEMKSSSDGGNEKSKQEGDAEDWVQKSDLSLAPHDFSQYNSHATLVVVTPALVTQWFNEIRKVTGDSLVCEYFDPNTGEFESRSSQQQQQQQDGGIAKKVDIVVTTYNAFDMTKTNKKRKRGKHPATILKSICWKRVCLDEMQELRSDKSSISKNIEELDCDRRWMVSGSPLFEGLGDLRGELAFLRLVPFGANVEDGFWDYAIRQPFEDENHHAIELLLSLGQVMLRREKSTRVIETGACILDLPKYSLEFVEVLPTDDERAVYCGLEYLNHDLSEGQQLVGKGKERAHFVRLLRSACTAPALLYPELKAINNLWTKIHRQTHATMPQSAILSCLEAIHYLSQIEDSARVDNDFVTDQTLGGSRGASIRNRAAVPIGPSRKEATEILVKATAKLKQAKSSRYKALWHYLLEQVTTGQYPFPHTTNTSVSDDEKKQKKNSEEWKFFWTCRGLSLLETQSSISEEMLTRGWRPGPLFCMTESENPGRDEQFHGLQRRISPFPCYFSHALTNPLSVYITAIPREVESNDLVSVFESLSDVIKNHVTVLPLEPDQNAQCWNAFAIFESNHDYDAFSKLTRHVHGVELTTSTPIPWIEDRIRNAQARVNEAKVMLEREKLSEATKELRTAQRGLRIFWKRNTHFREGNVMCTFSEEFKLRNTTPSTYFEPYLDEIMVKIVEQSNIIREQMKNLARLKKIEDRDLTISDSSGSSTFEVLQNLRHGRGEDECSVCRDVFLAKEPGEDKIKLTRCGHILCSECYEYIHDVDMKDCAICRKAVRLTETKVVDPKKREDPNSAEQRRKQAEEQLGKVAQELKATHGRLSASTWRNLYERFPGPVDSNQCCDVMIPALPGHFLAHLKNATGIPIVCNKSTAALVENSSQYSSKIRALLKDLPKDERSVVFASSKDIVMLLRKVFDIEGIQHRALYTAQPAKESGCAINEWQTIASCRVLLVQAGAAACGLTLTAARKMFIMDPFQRHEEEKQAYARIHRIGQTQKVEIKVYYSPVSVEARLLDWRQRAGSENPDAETITNVVHGASMDEEDDDDNHDHDVGEDDQMEFLLGHELSDVEEEENDEELE